MVYIVDETLEESWTAKGEYYIIADNLASETLEKSRVTKHTRVKDVLSST